MAIKNLTPGELFIFDWQYQRLGSFKTALIDAIIKADNPNRNKLEIVFPDEVAAYRRFANENGWWKRVEKLALAGDIDVDGTWVLSQESQK